MVTLKGMLAAPGPGKPARLTAGQKELVKHAVAHALQHAINQDDAFAQLFGGFVADTVARALDEYPTDRSCHTCDFERSGHCANNDHAEIPVPFRNDGCDDWKDEGAPF